MQLKNLFRLGLITLSLLTGFQMLPGETNAAVPVFTPIMRDAKGEIINADQYTAKFECEKQGNRLPTVRELALYAQSMGAKGISETPQDGYVAIEGTGIVQTDLQKFYYSKEGYQGNEEYVKFRPWFWTLSNYQSYTNRFYNMDGRDGTISVQRADKQFALSAIICVKYAEH